MLEFRDWLNRAPAQKKPRRPLPRVTKKRAKQLREYSGKAEAFLFKHLICQAWLEANGWKEFDDGYAKDAGDYRYTAHALILHFNALPSNEVHHREGRIGRKLLNESTWMALSRPWHEWIHQHPGSARAKGWLK